MNKTNKYSICDIITVSGILLLIFGFSLLHLLTTDKSFSEDENRSLQTFPRFSAETLLNGKFTAAIASYCSDQMPFRDTFVGAKAVAEIGLGKFENNGVLLGLNGHIIAKQDYNDYSDAESSIAALKRFAEYYGDIPVHLAVAGRSQDVLSSFAPSLYPAEDISRKTYDDLSPMLDGLNCINLKAPLKARAESGEYVYYRTDHHWTTLGAYYAYAEIMRVYGMEPYPLEYFDRQTASSDFYGTTWSKAGMKWIDPDTIEFFRYPGDDTFKVEIGTAPKSGLYDMSYLDGKSKYSSFIGETFAKASIYPAEESPLASEDREKLLLIKDSFAHSVAPFLALHFDIEMIDLRHYRFSASELIEEKGIDRVLVLYNMDSILNTSSLSMLTMGLD